MGDDDIVGVVVLKVNCCGLLLLVNWLAVIGRDKHLCSLIVFGIGSGRVTPLSLLMMR